MAQNSSITPLSSLIWTKAKWLLIIDAAVVLAGTLILRFGFNVFAADPAIHPGILYYIANIFGFLGLACDMVLLAFLANFFCYLVWVIVTALVSGISSVWRCKTNPNGHR